MSDVKTVQASLQERLDKAEAAPGQLTPARQRGKRQIKEEGTLLAAIERIEKQYRVQGLFHLDYQAEVEERQVRRHLDTPAHTERKVRFHLTVRCNLKAIAAAEFQAGWRIYATNAPPERLSLSTAVLAYRDQYIEENIFRRLQGKFLSITPLYIQRDDHAEGLFHFLTLCARLLALGDSLAREALAKEQSELKGVFAGNPKRGTARPTTERMLASFLGNNVAMSAVADENKAQDTYHSSTARNALGVRIGMPW